MTSLYKDNVFASIDHDLELERVGGGFETEVYSSDDRRFIVKLKSELGSDLPTALHRARGMRNVAERFTACLGSDHTIPNQYLLARDDAGRVQILVIQPFIRSAQPLNKVDYQKLRAEERRDIARQLLGIVRRTIDFYHETGLMPDLYGLSSSSKAERQEQTNPLLLPWHLWNFIFGRDLLRSWNLLLLDPPDRRIVLVDYDIVRWPHLVRRLYFATRRLLCWRDEYLIHRMQQAMIPPSQPTPIQEATNL